MNALRDQRSMVGLERHKTVADVEAAWRAWVEEPGHVIAYRHRRGDLSIDLRESAQTVVAYVSGGKWVADCPICNGGIACWWENPRGACLDCGTIFFVDHPAEDERHAVDDLLSTRPDPNTRSWHRHLGETIDELRAENDRYLPAAAKPSGVVSVDAIASVLGPKAIEQLQAKGVV